MGIAEGGLAFKRHSPKPNRSLLPSSPPPQPKQSTYAFRHLHLPGPLHSRRPGYAKYAALSGAHALRSTMNRHFEAGCAGLPEYSSACVGGLHPATCCDFDIARILGWRQYNRSYRPINRDEFLRSFCPGANGAGRCGKNTIFFNGLNIAPAKAGRAGAAPGTLAGMSRSSRRGWRPSLKS